MGEVVSLESFRRARAQRGAAGTSVPGPNGLVGTVERLALAVRALEDALTGSEAYDQGEVRRDATMDDFRNFTKLAQTFGVLDSAGGVICEPNDTPLDSRHLDMTYALQTLTDKVYMGNVVSGVNAADTLAMSSILFGSRQAIFLL